MSRNMWGAVMALGTAVVLVAGCSSSGDAPGGESASTSPAPLAPTGAAVVVEALDTVASAELWETDGVTLAVPDSAVTKRTEDGEVVQLFVYEESSPSDAVVVSVRDAGRDITDHDVNVQNSFLRGEVSRQGATDVVTSPATWGAWPYATALRAKVDEGDGVTRDVLSIQSREASGRFAVTGTARAPEGTLESSWQYQVLRTVRPS